LDADVVQRTFSPVELNGLLEALAEDFRDSHSNATLVTDMTSDELTVRGDLELLARAVMNLLENAAMHVGNMVTISLCLSRENRQALIAIADDGPGIPPDLAKDVFQRFRRGDAARSGRGSGLGLSIVQALISCHGGTIRLLPSNEPSGTRFEIALPLATANASRPIGD
jgi:two-component system OmpR family sensor kinase